MTEWGTILAMVSGASLLILGLVTGYWRGMKRMQRAQGLDALADVGQAILSAQLNLDALCEIVYQQSTRVIDTRNFQIGIIDGDDYTIKVWLREAERMPAQTFKGGASEGLIGWVKQQATGLLIQDYQKEWDRLPAHPRYHDESVKARAAIFAPLVAGGKVIGVIAAQSPVPRTFTQEDLRRLTVLASQAAGAIRNAQLYEDAHTQASRLRLIFKVSRQITAIQPLPDLFRQIVIQIQETFGYYAVNIFVHDETSSEQVLGATSAANTGFRNIRLKPGQGIVGWVAQTGKTASVRDVSQDKRYLHYAALEATRSEMAVPLIFEDEVLGVLDIQSNQLDAFNKDDIFTMNTLARQLALAIKEATTYDQERKQSERINALIEVARAVVSILDTSRLLDEVVELIDDYFGYDRVHLFLNDGNDRLVFRAGSGMHTKKWAEERLTYTLTDNGFIPWVASHSRPLVSGNVQSDERYVVGLSLDDTTSEMTVPIQMGPHVLGVLDIQSPKPDAFTNEDVALVQALADTIAVTLRNARLIANEMRRRILSETLREVSTVLASSLDLESVLKEILLGLERVVQYTSAIILLLNDEQTHFVVSAVHGINNEEEIWGEMIPGGSDVDNHIDAILTRLAQASDGEEHDSLSVPLRISEQCIGYLAIKRVGSSHFATEETEIVTTFANQAGVAIINAQLYMAQKEEAWVSTALLQVAEATGQATTPDDVLQTVARITPLLAGVEWCAVFLREHTRFQLVEVAGVDETLAEKLVGFSAQEHEWTPLQDMMSSRRPILIDSTTPMVDGFPIDANFLQAVLLPLFAVGEVFGMLVIGQREGDPPLTARKIELASGIANQAAVAIDRAQLYTAQQEEQWITTVLLQVAEAVNSQFDLDSTLETIVRYTTLLVGVTECGILQWDPNAILFRGSRSSGLEPHAEAAFATMRFTPEEDNIFARLSMVDDTIVKTTDPDCPFPPSLRTIFTCDDILGIPLSAQGTLVGALLVDYSSIDKANEQRQLHILEGVADQCALAIQTAKLQEEAVTVRSFEREMELARGIQLSLLPEDPPHIENWELEAYYRPARLVGGDFYDFIPLADGKYGLVIADVTDKGVAAAMFMTISRTVIRAVASSRRSPRETLIRVNRLMMQMSRSGLFFTCWYAILDPHDGTLAFSNGGHNPPLLIRENGYFHELRIKGMAIGVVEDIRLRESTVKLRPGDTLLTYTDGLTEARREDMTEFGEADLYINAVKFNKLPAKRLVRKIVNAVDNFTAGQPAFDDLTLFVLKRQQESTD